MASAPARRRSSGDGGPQPLCQQPPRLRLRQSLRHHHRSDCRGKVGRGRRPAPLLLQPMATQQQKAADAEAVVLDRLPETEPTANGVHHHHMDGGEGSAAASLIGGKPVTKRARKAMTSAEPWSCERSKDRDDGVERHA